MSFRYKILTINASLFLIFVGLFVYGTTQYVKGSYDNQLDSIKSGIIGQNTKLLETFVQSQNALLEEKADFILEEIKYLSLVFQSSCVHGYPTLEHIGESLNCINETATDYINNIAFIDLSKNIQISLEENGSTSIVRYLSKQSPLWASESAFKYKTVEDKVTKRFFILQPISGFPNVLLKFELDLGIFFRAMSSDELDDYQYRFLLLDGDGNFIASNLDSNFNILLNTKLTLGKDYKTLREFILNEDSGSLTVKTTDNIYNIIHRKNDTMKWKVILVTPESYLHSSYVSTRELLLSSDNLLVEKIFFSSLALFTLFLVLIYITVMKTFRPINELINQANYLKDRDFSNVANIVYHHGDEIEVLSRAFSEAGRTIKLLVEGLEDEVKLRTEQYEKAAKEALDATKKKSTLLSNVSHEIRTPLNAIIGYLHMLRVDKCDGSCSHELEGIRTASNTILDIVNDLLDFERLDSVNYKLHPKHVPINKITRDLEKTFHPLANQKGLKLSIVKEGIGGSHQLFVDELRFQQALSNIITNAIKFTDVGKIEISISMDTIGDQRMVVFAVRDTGRGIREEDLDTIFNSFEQANQEDKQFGFGLGLAITKAIINLMGGVLAVESKIKQGSIFKIALPISMLTHNVLLVGDEHDESADNESIEIQSFDGIKALVVDDVEFNREILQYHLNLLGIECITAIDGVDALNKLESNVVDVVLTDVSMPNMGGVELANRTKIMDPTLPIIAVTARATVQEEEKMSHHFNNYITKPVNEVDLMTALSLTLHK
ncbi:ATP-binding protein [Vibrio campbellii]|uniref:ATP-binding protein n=1 Tax=Vibrio campbellii TaxID=680 RepID=UPI000154342C|nr:ATP-binding protein [Vibrio campbellii]EDL69235.1 putative sensor protein RcsC [Vibrio campbellii HY01]OQQ03931.1 hybrid sensor histidine kinase/response regulator [Vibrio campbellii]